MSVFPRSMSYFTQQIRKMRFIGEVINKRTIKINEAFYPFQFGSIKKSDIPISVAKVQKIKNDIKKPNQIKKLEIKPAHKNEMEQASTSDVLECSNPEFNKNVFENGSLRLYSKYWSKSKYKNQWIHLKKSINHLRNTIKTSDYSWEDFLPDLLHPSLISSLKSIGCNRPTEIQGRMLRYISSTNHIFLAAETGSGKTVAYAVPIINELLKNKETKAVIIVPTTILAKQVNAVLEKLVKNNSIQIKNQFSEESSESWNLIIGTPGFAISSLRKVPTERIQFIVMDEADVLLDTSFVDDITDILSLVSVRYSETNPVKNDGAKVIFSSASCPDEIEIIVDGVVNRRYISYVKSSNLHQIIPAIDIKLIRLKEMDKLDRLTELLNKDLTLGELNQTLVFCKDGSTANFVYGKLKEAGCNVIQWKKTTSKEEINDCRVIVATDAAARGADLPHLSHIIMYDMASYVVDFLHRCGRVGRLSSLFPSRITAFVRTSQEIDATMKIEAAARLKRSLRFIETDISGMIERKKENK